ncbi:MAG: hypothetical protein AAB628_00775 [Patescibacteria group bacterium]
MESRFKKSTHVFSATLIGILVIFFAWYISRDAGQKEPVPNTELMNTLTISPGSGASLSGNNASSPRSLLNSTEGISEEPATTTTSILARNFLIQYAAEQERAGDTPLSDSQTELMAKQLVQGVKLPQGKQYTPSDLNISNDNSAVALAAYDLALKKVLIASAKTKTENELKIFVDSLQKDDLSRLSAITPILANYDALIKGLLVVKTPSKFASFHLRFIQTYSNIRNFSSIMQGTSLDPIGGIVAVREYKKEIATLEALAKEYPSIVPK